jgi:signal transduction histidine kinase
MARIEAGRLSCEVSEVFVDQLVTTAVNAVLPSADKKSIAIMIESVDKNYSVKTAPDRVVQILVNFVSNAIKYSPENTDVVITTSKLDAELVRISVRDSGRGIPEDQLSMIFEAFQQVSREDRHKGTGLGLTICKMLAESLGARVGVESTVNKGSTFWLDLPASVRNT